MSSIGGPGGVGGPKGPGGPGRPEGPGGAEEAREVERGERAEPTGLDRLAADISSGKLTAQQAIERMVDDLAASEHLGPSERAELRDLLTDLVANDPYLSSLIGRL